MRSLDQPTLVVENLDREAEGVRVLNGRDRDVEVLWGKGGGRVVFLGGSSLLAIVV